MGKKKRKSTTKKMETSKKLAWWAVVVASVAATVHYTLTAFSLEPSAELTVAIFTACIGYLITYAGKSLGEKVSRNKHGLDADGNPLNAVKEEEHP